MIARFKRTNRRPVLAFALLLGLGLMGLTDNRGQDRDAVTIKDKGQISEWTGPVSQSILSTTYSPAASPTLVVVRTASGLSISFTGTLQCADSVIGPWTEMAATSPTTVTADQEAKFYRSKQEAPRAAGATSAQLESKTFYHVEPNTFSSGTSPARKISPTNLVRATKDELGQVERAIQVLNTPPPHVNLEAKFVEIGHEDHQALGFELPLGNTLMFGGKTGSSVGSSPASRSAPTAANPGGIPPGSSTSSGTQPPPAVGTSITVLTDPQFRIVIHALEHRPGIDVLSAPSVTTLSGRQAQIQLTTDGRQILAGASPAIAIPTVIAIPTGPTLDIIPNVDADGYTIQMTLIPSILNFLGYGNPDFPEAAQFEDTDTIQDQAGKARSPIPLPRFLVRQITTNCTVWDGQTVVLGGLISDDVRRQRDKLPVLADIPMLGRLFRSETSGYARKNLVVFVTVKIIDPAGNPVHSDDNLPYDPNVIPPRRAVLRQGVLPDKTLIPGI